MHLAGRAVCQVPWCSWELTVSQRRAEVKLQDGNRGPRERKRLELASSETQAELSDRNNGNRKRNNGL